VQIILEWEYRNWKANKRLILLKGKPIVQEIRFGEWVTARKQEEALYELWDLIELASYDLLKVEKNASTKK
jgi:hypothetical protein